MKKLFSALLVSILVLAAVHSEASAQAKTPTKKTAEVSYSINVEKSNTAVGVTLIPTTVGINFTLSMLEKGATTPQTKTANAALNQKTAIEFTGLKASTAYSLTVSMTPTDTSYTSYSRTFDFTTTYGNTGNPSVGSTNNWDGSAAGGDALPKPPTGNGNDALPKSNCAPNCPPQVSNTQNSDLPLDITLKNPLGVSTVQDAIKKFMDAVVKIAIPFIVVFFIWSGLQFILARGNADKLKTAKQAFWWTVVGTLLILGAWAITDAIVGTINSIAS